MKEAVKAKSMEYELFPGGSLQLRVSAQSMTVLNRFSFAVKVTVLQCNV